MKKNILNLTFILTLIVGLVFSTTNYGQDKNYGEILLNANGDSHIVSNYQPENIQTLYYDQTAGTVAGTGPASQDFETTYDEYDNQAADNFTVTAGPWTINQVVVGGGYFNGSGPSLSFNVFFYSDASGIPGSLVATRTAQPYVYDGSTYFTISISPAVVLTNGNYWISVQSRMDFAVGGQFAWDVVSGAYGSVAQWQNPGGGFGVCPTWGPITTCNGTTQTDLSFALYNIAGPGYATNPDPANGATNVPGPNVMLSWTNPAGTTNNSVYFGTSPGSLAQIYTGVAISTINRTGLSGLTTYYWRVDETDGTGTTTGNVWSFTTAPSAALTLPYSQSFDGSTFPVYWSQTSTISNRWTVSNTSNAGGTPYEMMATWTSGTGISRLIVGPINTTGTGSINLAFKHFYDDYGAGVTIKIQSSSDLTNWTDEAWSYASGGGNLGPQIVNTTVTNNLGAQTYVAWVIDGDHYQFDFWYVDDVSITQPFANDVGTESIDLAASISVGTVAPKATVRNYGTATQTFTVNMTITGGYSSTKTVTALGSGLTQQVTFDNWNATPGVYTVNVCTQLGGDQNTANDCKSKNVGVFTGSWTSGTVYPTTTYLGSGVAANGYLFSIGGNTNSGLLTECYKYNVATDTWTPIASLPAGRRVLATAAVGNFIYAIGGSDISSVYQSTVYKYDIAGDTWTTVASLPVATGWGKAVGYNNKIYFAGGVDATSTVLATVYVYDVAGDTWTAATSMPGPKFGGAFSVVGNKLVYVAGANATVISSDVYVGTITADPTVITWTTMMNLYPGVGKETYSINPAKLDELIAGKPVKNENTEATAYPPGTMYRFDAAPWGTDGMIVANGSPTATWVPANPNPCYVYKPDTDTWVQQADVPIPVLGASLGSVNTTGSTWKLIVASGYTGSVVTNVTQVYTDNLGGATTFQLTVNIANGWNMVSVPGTNPDGMGVNTWWAYRDMGANVFKYAGGYQAVTTTVPGIGYWMKHTGARSYNTGDEWPAGGIQIVAHDPIAAASGWNLFGGYETSVATSGLTTNPPGLITGSVYKYSGGYTIATTLDPGYGYWVKLTGAGQIIIPNALAKGEAVEMFPDSWGKIVLTDATGINYTLYAVKGDSPNGGASVDLSQYELPPAPPQGMFDIRYSSGRIAEDINSSVKAIDLSGVTYPLTVRVEGMDMRLMDETGKLINLNLKKGEDVVISDATIQKLMVSGELIPDKYSLEQNYPNPFNPSTVIEFSLPENVSNVKLTIYSILGEKVAELVNTSLVAGKYSYQWNASNVATGMYIYELRTDKFVSTKKMMLLK